MAGFIISVAQSKGGVGKSTLASQLAVACSDKGHRVKMVDLDQQASLTAWAALRDRVEGAWSNDVEVKPGSAWRLPFILERLKREADLVIIDGASNRDDDFSAMVNAADLILIPCQPTGFDLWATKALLANRPDLLGRFLVVLNRMPARGKASALIRQEIEKLGWPLAAQHIGNRQAYVQAVGMGLGVTETAPASQAGQEIGTLALEILERLFGDRMVA